MATQPATPALVRIVDGDATGQLLRNDGTMRRLGSDQGVPMLDWVQAVPRALADPDALERVEAEARDLLARGVHHVIWAGMGGSVLTVQVLRGLGFGHGALTIHPLDSTDPAALNTLVRDLAVAKGVDPPTSAPEDATRVHALFADVVMVGVAMGMTSEEPISHLEWFASLLQMGGLPLAAHQLVMCIPGSFLERYALAHDVPRLPLQLDGGAGTPGRMSAPGTRVFLLPVALDLAARGAAPGTLRAILRRAWSAYDLAGAVSAPADHPYVRLAAALADAARDGAVALYTALPPDLDPLRWWMEQVMEESLGKGNKGVVIFTDQPLAAAGQSGALSAVRLRLVPGPAEPVDGVFTLSEPLLGAVTLDDRLAGVAAVFLGLQLAVALYGYLNDIQFAGQPAVELYKSRARHLRDAGAPLSAAAAVSREARDGALALLPPPGAPAAMSPAQAVAQALTAPIAYLDLTVNGELTGDWPAEVERRLRRLGNERLGAPVKFRRAPASYHSTEQSEMDGPPGLVSLRALARRGAASALGAYDANFLRAQAVGTWMAMNEQGRACFLLLSDGTDGELGPALCDFLDRLAGSIC